MGELAEGEPRVLASKLAGACSLYTSMVYKGDPGQDPGSDNRPYRHAPRRPRRRRDVEITSGRSDNEGSDHDNHRDAMKGIEQ